MILWGSWTVTLPDEEYVWEPDDVTIGEQLMIEGELGDLSYNDWPKAIDDRRPVACQVLIWYLRHKAGKQQERFAVDFPIRRLELMQIGTEDEPDPEAPAASEAASSGTAPKGSTSRRGTSTD